VFVVSVTVKVTATPCSFYIKLFNVSASLLDDALNCIRRRHW